LEEINARYRPVQTRRKKDSQTKENQKVGEGNGKHRCVPRKKKWTHGREKLAPFEERVTQRRGGTKRDDEGKRRGH